MRLIQLSALALFLAGTAAAEAPPASKPNQDQKQKPSRTEQLSQNARNAIVTIRQFGRAGEQEALGAGFFVRPDGLIATNLHVIGNARRLQVETAGGTRHEVAEIHATDDDLDLALIKINGQDFPALSLGNSDLVKQGQPILAIGHPQGLAFSVVEGVVSAMRDVEGSQMLQLAVPIEEGNSGGPVLDRNGNVQGILTLKSALTQNLGFAHPVNDLKRLIKRPNPIPMERWLTIGRLNEKIWKTHLGSRWTQHAGQIHVEDPGEGFGGRSLCLHLTSPPALPYEISVDVRLADEAGAAGLLFCADGGDRHYGFYPSNGKLRLTRFDGPDFFSWTVLGDLPSDAYLRNRWNTLRVRVETDKIQCFVNDQLVLESSDATFRDGHAGLCKFRNTAATFKAFQLGSNLANAAISPALAASLQQQIHTHLQQAHPGPPSEELLAAPSAVLRRLIEQQTIALEQQAASLRALQKSLHRQQVTRELVSLLQQPDPQTPLLQAALMIAWHDNPDIDPQACQQTVGRMADELRNDPAIRQGNPAAARRLSDFLFKENGLHGSRGDEIDKFSNSYLNEVLDDREGIPITLAIVYLELARQLGLKDIHGAGLPGRFMVFYTHKEGARFIDVFDQGRELSPAEAAQFIQQTTGQTISDEHLQPATVRSMVLRLLYNLVSFCKEPQQTLPYLDLILAVDPDSSGERLNRALLRAQEGDAPGARQDLDYLIRTAPAGLDLSKLRNLYDSL